jgi:deoxyadenosine/deoxycytidine kinase
MMEWDKLEKELRKSFKRKFGRLPELREMDDMLEDFYEKLQEYESEFCLSGDD